MRKENQKDGRNRKRMKTKGSKRLDREVFVLEIMLNVSLTTYAAFLIS